MKFRKLRNPLHVQWELTPNCNYKCFHCYNFWRATGNVSNHIDYDIVVNQLIENHIFDVTLTGGEPLLVFSKIKPYIEKMLKAGIKVSINTNAALLTQEMAEFFRENKIGLLISLPCCIPEINDQITTVKGSYDLTVAGIKLARRNHVSVSVNMVVSKLNKDYIIETARFLRDELGLKAINVTRASRPINGISEFDQSALNLQELRKVFQDLLYIKKEYAMYVDSLTVYPSCACDSSETFQIFAKRKCFAGKTAMAIGYNGDVKACARDSVSYGNLNVNSLRECWDKMDDWRIPNYEELPSECINCGESSFCAGGCRIENRNEIPNKSCRDFHNDPMQYEFETTKSVEYDKKDIFTCVEDLKFFEEDFGVRGVNSRRESFFITKFFYDFLMARHTFSKEQLMQETEVSSEEANDVLAYLIKNKAIELN